MTAAESIRRSWMRAMGMGDVQIEESIQHSPLGTVDEENEQLVTMQAILQTQLSLEQCERLAQQSSPSAATLAELNDF